jgi:hypothetical protein
MLIKRKTGESARPRLAALAGAAAFLVAGELEFFADEINQAVVIGHHPHDLAAVDGGRNLDRGVTAIGGRSADFGSGREGIRHEPFPWEDERLQDRRDRAETSARSTKLTSTSRR